MRDFVILGVTPWAFVLIVVFPAWAQDAKGVGVVTALTGQADLKRAQAPQLVALKLRDHLYVRDVVDTHTNALARILLLGKSTVTVRELSRFQIREEVLPDGGQRGLIDLAAGKIRVMVARRLMKPGEEIQIRTLNTVASVRGSDGIIVVTRLPDGTARTVVTGVSGEFAVTLPRIAPIAAMAETASDAASGIRLVQLQTPGGQIIRGLDRLQVDGAPGFQQVLRSVVSLQDLLQELRLFKGLAVASGTGAGNARTSEGREVVQARTETTRDGGQPGIAQGGGGVNVVITNGPSPPGPPITPLNRVAPPPPPPPPPPLVGTH